MTEIHFYDPEHQLIKMQIKDMLPMNIVNWKYNRPADEIRCSEITEYFTKYNPEIVQPFVLHNRTSTDEFEVLDGIHRWTSLVKIGNTDQMRNKYVLVHIFSNKSDGFLVDLFQNLNKTVPVPNLYMNANNDDTTQKQIIEHVTKDWIKKYSSHFSPNRNCNVPNINRDTFIDLITEIYNSKKVRSKEQLEELLQKANQSIKEQVETGSRLYRIKPSDKQKEKCSTTGCYLFLCRPDVIKTIIC